MVHLVALKSLQERRDIGRDARRKVPRSAHAEWSPAKRRPDPVALLMEQDATRVPWLVPVRHSRMSVNPFTFYRGTARIMACDLAGTPNSGLEVQLGGDAHLSNFGAYASPERSLIADANDFDETLRGPWEWDLKRLAASFLVATRYRGLPKNECRRITARVTSSYRSAMATFAEMGFLDLWYTHSTVQSLLEVADSPERRFQAVLRTFEERARHKNNLQALEKLAEDVNGRFRIRSDRPVLVPIREVLPEFNPEEIEAGVRRTYDQYIETLRPDRRMLLERYELIDVALKVVGVGSVGTRCFVMLLEGRDHGDPLFLQAKEANASVLEEYLQPSPLPHHGQRVVEGQRMIQAQSDIFLGWCTGEQGYHYYVRQLRDWKGSANIDELTPNGLSYYASICGFILARGHARTGDAAAISAYIGNSDKLDKAMVRFSERYADQTEQDFLRFLAAIESGRIASGAEFV